MSVYQLLNKIKVRFNAGEHGKYVVEAVNLPASTQGKTVEESKSGDKIKGDIIHCDYSILRSDIMFAIADYPEIRLELGEAGHAFQVRFIKIETNVTPEVTPEVRLIVAVSGEMTRKALQDALDLKDEEHFRKTYLIPALDSGFIEMTIPDKPRSGRQKYRLTKKGQEAVKQWQR